MFRSIVLLLGCWLLATPSIAQYKPVGDKSSVQFNVKHFGIKTSGTFSGLQGQVIFDENNLEKANIQMSVDPGTIRTGVDLRDDHLRGEGYFEVAKYPRMDFVSTKITAKGKDGELLINGQLTIKGHTKDISFSATATRNMNGYLFNANFIINRKDFDIGGSGVISENVEVLLNIYVIK